MRRIELVLEPRTPRALVLVRVREEDHDVLAVLRSYHSARAGRPLAEHEVVTRVLADALAHIETDLRAAGFRLGASPTL